MTIAARILITNLVWLLLVAAHGTVLQAQDDLVVRPSPPALDDFETDANKDGVPDGWYNARDAKLMEKGGAPGVGPHCLRFETTKPGRPARLSRAFGIDGSKTEAIIIGLWVRVEQIAAGERLGEDPALLIDFLGDQLRALRRGLLGPWASSSMGTRWTHVAKRIPVPPGTHDAIMSVGLLGATGVLEVDGLTITLIPVGGTETTNLVVNGGFELGDPSPAGWIADGGASRVMTGYRSISAVELPRPHAKVLSGLGVPVEPFGALELSVMVKATALRGSGGAGGNIFFLDDDGHQVIDPMAENDPGVPLLRWGGRFDWRPERVRVLVPRGATRAVVQFEKMDGPGALLVDNVSVVAVPNPAAGAWVPDHAEDDTADWPKVAPSPKIEPQSALDASYLLDAPAGKHGFVTVRDRRLAFTKGGRARFFGVYLLAPTAFLDAERAVALADRLARSGVNLVRIGDLDTAIGPDRSLFEDSRDDTKAFDPIALAKLDHLFAALKARGIYIALELQSTRRFREGDGVADPNRLPMGGGAANVFDPTMGKLALNAAKALIEHVNPETGLALRDEPALAWVTLAGELTLFDLMENPLPASYELALKELARKRNIAGRKLWEKLGIEHWTGVAEALRQDKLRVPIAGVSHWRRDPEFSAEQAEPGLDLIDDRLYWLSPTWIAPDRRSILWSTDGGLGGLAILKRQSHKPYVVGQWCHQTLGAWATPFEAADDMLAASTASSDDWDALVRRGLFIHPEPWGADAAGTGGGEDIFQIPEVVNGIPQVYALWPHSASIMLRGAKAAAGEKHPATVQRAGSRPRLHTLEGWDPSRGRLVIDTPYTQGIAGWQGDEPARFETLSIDNQSRYGVVVASSAGTKPIATTDRLLVSAVGRVSPSKLRYIDHWKREVADPGIPPLLQETITARVRWRHKGTIKAYALDNTGARIGEVKLSPSSDGVDLVLDGLSPGFHWELVAE